jgi:DNA polymerase
MRLGREQLLRELELLPEWRRREIHGQKMAEAAPHVVTKPVFEPASVPEVVPVVAEQHADAGLLSVPTGESGKIRDEAILQMDWQALQQCVAQCEACPLSKTRTQTVFGVGDPDAEWLFVGEAPGVEEDYQGEPFVGQAGRLLDNMLLAISLKRGLNVYIANVLKCRPPDNRDPHRGEITECAAFLKRQVELIKPKLIVALGRVAAQSLLNTQANVTDLRGKQYFYHGVPVIVTYHPAYLLRNLPDKAKAWDDLCFARSVMQLLSPVVSA